jgi:glycosyltransferase involved in cell wall biosynthesis
MSHKVSIVLPSYNQAHYLPSALDSIFTQTYQNFELIVVNDGSTDHTAEVLAEYKNKYPFRVVNQENQKLPRALNTGFAQTSGEYLTWTSSDNILLPEMLSILVGALEKYPKIGLVYADRYLMDENAQDIMRLNTPEYDPYLLLHVNLVQCCFLYRRECHDKVGGYDPTFIYGEDWDYWIRISKYFPMKHIDSVPYRYRLHMKSLTSELALGKIKGMGFLEFSARIRQRMPVRWSIGKIKWRLFRLLNKHHPAVFEFDHWSSIVALAAGNKTGDVTLANSDI